jgi:hypothetical protein
VTAATGVVARWAGHPCRERPSICGECGAVVEAQAERCPGCRQAVPAEATGMLAVVVETTGGARRLVVAHRSPGGGWAPTRDLPATGEAVRMLRRQDATAGGAA